MKIKELKLLPKHYLGCWYSGMGKLGPNSWGDWVLVAVNGGILTIRVREGLKNAGQQSTTQFFKKRYDSLDENIKQKLDDVLEANTGKTIREILELEIEV